MKFQKTSTAAVVAGLLAVPVSNAQADAIASAVIKFTGFQLFGVQLNPDNTVASRVQIDISDLADLDFTSTADADVNLFNTTESIDGASDSGANGIDFPTSNAGGTESPVGNDLCIGDCTGDLVGPTQNDNEFALVTWPQVTAAGLSDYAWSDQLEEGAPITGLTNDSGAVASSATVNNSSYAYIQNPSEGAGGANSDNGLNADFVFAVNEDVDAIEVQFTVDANAYALITSEESAPPPPLLAAASYLYTLDIDQGTGWQILDGPGGNPLTTLGSLTDAGGVSTQNPSATNMPSTEQSSATIFARTNRGYTAGTLNTLTARTETSVEVVRNAELVSAPATLGLLGLGLFALGAIRRRVGA